MRKFSLVLIGFAITSYFPTYADEHGHSHSHEEVRIPVPSKRVRRETKPISKPEEEPTVVEKKSEFELEKGLVNTIYQNSLVETAASPSQNFSKLIVTPQLSVINPQKLRLVNNYFYVDHIDTLKALPTFALAASAPLTQLAGFSVSYSGRVGYAFRESFTKVKAASGLELVDQVKVHWLTFGGGLGADYQFFNAPWLRPFVTASLGMQWLYQGGKLDGLEQGFWLPFYEMAAGLTLFSNPRVSSEWFGGLNIGASARRSLGSEQISENWSLDLGLNLYL